VGIGLETTVGAEVYNNTIYQEHSYQAAISARFAASSVYVANNLIHIAGGGGNAVWARNGAAITQEANVLAAQASWFTDLAGGDLHLKTSVPSVVDQAVPVGGLSEDFDGDARPAGSAPDVGADELTSTSGGSTLVPSSWGSVKAAWRG
jgi:hypothetical protein